MENTRIDENQGTLVTFNLKMESLREVLAGIVETVNSHTEVLKRQETRLGEKMNRSDFHSTLTDLSRSIPMTVGGKPVLTGSFKDTIESLKEGLAGLSSFAYESRAKHQSLEESVEKLQKSVQSKCDIDKVKDIGRKLDDKLDRKVSVETFADKVGAIKSQIDRLEDLINVKNKNIENTMKEIQMNTLWKIKDCEELLSTRVNKQFVWDSIESMSHSILNKNSAFNDKRFISIESFLKDLKSQCDKMNDDYKNATFTNKLEIIKSNEKIGEISERLTELNDVQPSISGIQQAMGQINLDIEQVSSKVGSVEESIKETVPLSSFESLQIEVQTKANCESIQKMKEEILNMPKSGELDSEDAIKLNEHFSHQLRKIDADFKSRLDVIDVSGIKKMLNQKSNKEDIKIALNAIKNQLTSESDSRKNLVKDLFNVIKEISAIKKALNENKTGNSIASTRSLANHQCLSCGRHDTKVPSKDPYYRTSEKSLTLLDPKLEGLHISAKAFDTQKKTDRSIRALTQFRPQSAISHIK